MRASIAPAHCPECLRQNIVATAGGPTCQHTRGVDWWRDMPAAEHQRCAEIERRQLAAKSNIAQN